MAWWTVTPSYTGPLTSSTSIGGLIQKESSITHKHANKIENDFVCRPCKGGIHACLPKQCKCEVCKKLWSKGKTRTNFSFVSSSVKFLDK